MRVLAFLLALPGLLAADVVVLKDGGKVSGRVVEKGGHLEVTTEGGLRTFLKDEVDRIVTSPKEFLGDADKLIGEAKEEYQQIAAAGGADNARVRESLAKVAKARELLSDTRELFPEEKYSDLDQKLMQVMQLMRLFRDRLGSELARPVEPEPKAEPVVVRPAVSIADTFATLIDPAKRNEPARRVAARDAFRDLRGSNPEIYEVATAAMLFLSRTDQDWRIEGATLKVLQEYFAKPWVKEPRKASPADHQAAVAWIIEQVAATKKADAKSSPDALTLFAMGHLGHAPAGPEFDASAKALGLLVIGGIPGTPEGHAVRDMNLWIASGDFDLAVLAFVGQHRATDTPIVRFVWSYALLRLVESRKRGFERPVAALETLRPSEAAFRDHAAALIKSIKAVASCTPCGGAGKFRCTNCCGKKEIRTDCAKCKGKGKIPDPGYSAGGLGGGGFGGVYEIPCYPCRGRGFEKLVKCEKCKDGFIDCKQCPGPKPAPKLSQICASSACGTCDGRGYVFRRILWTCRSCMGLGRNLVPAADPAKTLP